MDSPVTRLTARDIDKRKRTPAQITELARRSITKEVLVTDNDHEIRSAFYVILLMLQFTPGARDRIGALIGPMSDVIPGRAMNGYPIFYSIDFLHRRDVEAYNAEIDRMKTALGTPITPTP